MTIEITVTLTEPFINLSIYDHIDRNKQLFPKPLEKKPDPAPPGEEEAEPAPEPEIPSETGLKLGPFCVETTGSSSRIGRLLFRHGKKDHVIIRLFDVKEGGNPLPPHQSFDAFALFVLDRQWEHTETTSAASADSGSRNGDTQGP